MPSSRWYLAQRRWPLCPGVVLAIALLEINSWHYMAAAAPVTLIAGAVGFVFFVKPIESPEGSVRESVSRYEARAFLWEIMPILIVVVVILAVVGLIGLAGPLENKVKYHRRGLDTRLSATYTFEAIVGKSTGLLEAKSIAEKIRGDGCCGAGYRHNRHRKGTLCPHRRLTLSAMGGVIFSGRPLPKEAGSG